MTLGLEPEVSVGELNDVEQRLGEALKEMQEQRNLAVQTDLQSEAATLTLLSHSLRQFCWLEDQRNGLAELQAGELPALRDVG